MLRPLAIARMWTAHAPAMARSPASAAPDSVHAGSVHAGRTVGSGPAAGNHQRQSRRGDQKSVWVGHRRVVRRRP
jgi:hypothetical protein